MGFFGDMYYETRGWVDNLRRDQAKIYLKMDLFVAQYGGRVINSGIPNSANGEGDLVRCYVRTVMGNGATYFKWFNDFKSAEEYASNCRASIESGTGTNVVEVIGPHPLPFSDLSRFE
jgi:hypothetical protein